LELNAVTESFDSVDQSALDPSANAFLELGTAQIVVEVGTSQQPMAITRIV
jgi:hypothetical protein